MKNILILVVIILLLVVIFLRKKEKKNIVIVTSHFKEDLSWLKKSEYPVIVADKIGADKPAIPADPKLITENFGKEATSYLKFITVYYDNLPEHTVFIHGHKEGWHQKLDIFEAIKSAKTEEYDYISLNNYFFDNRSLSSDYEEIRTAMKNINILWGTYFEPYLKIPVPGDLELFHDCCAQFIVSRRAIHRHPKKVYEHWLDLSLGKLTDKKSVGSREIAVVFELIWHVIFGEPLRITDPDNYHKKVFN